MPEPARQRKAVPPQRSATSAGPLSVPTGTPLVESPTSSNRASSAERRDLSARQALLRRVAVEYDEMPGLCLTMPQAQRLFGLRDDICARVLNTLVEAAVLRRDVTGLYRRNSGVDWPDV